jgi:uncharacterized RDD family membrane protein YckC
MAKTRSKRDLLAGAALGEDDPHLMVVTTPEGVTLPFQLASYATRMGAMALDLLFIFLTPVIVIIILVSVLPHVDFKIHPMASEILQVLFIAFIFFIRSGYFMFFEMGPKAATPGKRIMGLRVIAHDGGRLTPASLFIRNALREVELYLPVTLIFMSSSLGGWVGWLAFGWAMVLILLPLFNKQQARLGDFLGGTRVVRMPKVKLGYDLVDREVDVATGLIFSKEQLGLYGEKELALLEQVLRERRHDTMRAVADKIKARIGWKEPSNAAYMASDEHFLRAYYGALRAYLEGKMLLGKRRKDKHDEALT